MSDGGSHFDCEVVRDCCADLGTKHHVVAAYSPWINGLIEGSNKILLNTLKRLCAPGLGDDDYDRMAAEDIPRNWPEHLDAAVKSLSDRVLPSLKFSPNELFFALPIDASGPANPEAVHLPTETDLAIHMAYAEQMRLDGWSCAVDHAARRKAIFDAKVLSRAPREVIFKTGQLVQVYRSDLINVFSSERKLVPFWSPPRRVVSRIRNSYVLETLDSTPLSGTFNARRLRIFEPREGTKLATAEALRPERDNCGETGEQVGLETGDEVDPLPDGSVMGTGEVGPDSSDEGVAKGGGALGLGVPE
jgi:hypothetical protein